LIGKQPSMMINLAPPPMKKNTTQIVILQAKIACVFSS